MLEVTLTARACLAAASLFLLAGLLAGVWKYRHMMRAPTHQAPFYVDTAHRAALMYAFACVVLAALAAGSALPEWVNLTAAAVTVFYFAAAVATYALLGWRRTTDNQFERRTWHTTWGMYGLVAGEIGGVATLTVGFWLGQFG